MNGTFQQLKVIVEWLLQEGQQEASGRQGEGQQTSTD